MTLKPTEDTMLPISLDSLSERVVLPRVEFEHWLKVWDWTYHQLARGELPPGFKSLAEFQLACIVQDPVLWSAAFLRDADDPDLPYLFWDYQQPSIRHPGNTLHECGSEVGKTREIIAFILWKALTVSAGSGLVAAPMFVHLVEIIDAIVDQFNLNPDLARSLIRHRKHPHHSMLFSNRFKIDFRPAGYDGEAFRGVHVRTFSIFDEAAKAKNNDIWKEFWRASKPGCVHRVYSVPDGDRSTAFFKLCNRAEGKVEVGDDGGVEKDLEFRKFHWSKTQMPHPWWSEERRRFYIDQYGGEDSPGYQQNVLGNWGDPENSVFPWHHFSKVLTDIPEYRVLKIWLDESQREATIYQAEFRAGVDRDQRKTKPVETIIQDTRISLSSFDIRRELKKAFSPLGGLLFAGCDLGFTQDPTEIYVKQVIGRVHRLVARISLKGVSYDQQAEAIDCLDDIFDPGTCTMGWGIDFGNAGSAVVHMLHNQDAYAAKRYEDRLVGYQFGATYEAVDEDANLVYDKVTEKPLKLNGKELSTDLLVAKMQRQQLQYPHDPDIILQYPNHTYRVGQRHRIFKDVDDHTIDADRIVSLRIILPGDGREDIFV